jgi:hypothetical protein
MDPHELAAQRMDAEIWRYGAHWYDGMKGRPFLPFLCTPPRPQNLRLHRQQRALWDGAGHHTMSCDEACLACCLLATLCEAGAFDAEGNLR